MAWKTIYLISSRFMHKDRHSDCNRWPTGMWTYLQRNGALHQLTNRSLAYDRESPCNYLVLIHRPFEFYYYCWEIMLFIMFYLGASYNKNKCCFQISDNWYNDFLAYYISLYQCWWKYKGYDLYIKITLNGLLMQFLTLRCILL